MTTTQDEPDVGTPAASLPGKVGAALHRSAASSVNRTREALTAGDFWASAPPSLAAHWQYVKDGDWVPGKRTPGLECMGRVYGVIALLTTLALYAVAWVVQRPSRMVMTTIVGAATWWLW